MTAQHTPQPSATGEYRLAPSWQLAAILTAGHCGVAVLVALLDIPLVWQAAIFALLITSLGFELRTTALRRGHNAVVAVRISAVNVFSMLLRSGEWRECEVLGSTYVSSALTVLILRPAGAHRVRSVVLMPDSMEKDGFRRLRMWLRWRPQVKSD